MPDDAELPDVQIPVGLSSEASAVWDELAPLAVQQRTLTPATVARFQVLCRAIVIERKMEAKILQDGLTYIAVTVDGSGQERESLKAHPLCGAQRGMMQRVEAGLVAFRLAPIGKALAPDKVNKPKTALETLRSHRPALRAV